MGIWESARASLANHVVSHLGEDLVLGEAALGSSCTVRGVLVRPEARARLGGADYVMADAMLTIRTSDLPTWFARKTAVTAVTSGDIYRVVEFVENGEGITEVTLARSA